ncbi:aromatic amino acid lyase [Brachybacterium sp. DNPG3]
MSDRARLREFASAVATGALLPAWTEAEGMIDRERASALAFVSSHPETPVYGFTTLLGPLDHLPSSTRPQSLLVAGHLIGVPAPVDSSTARVIHAAKLAQLSAGGSGISTQTFRLLLDRFAGDTPVEIDLDSSYGSGDVVAATWWARAIVDLEDLPRGDLIALINGSFVGTALAALAVSRLERLLVRAVCVLATAGATTPTHPRQQADEEGSALLDELTALAGSTPGHRRIQLPVSMRSLASSCLPLLDVLERAEEEIERNLSRPSANPLWVPSSDDPGALAPWSQSSFLSFSLRFALDAVASATVLLSGLLQRATEQLADHARDAAGGVDLLTIQPPKVSEAYLRSVLSRQAHTGFTGSMSGGVEDLWDGVTPLSRTLLDCADLVEKQLEVVEEMLRADDGTADAQGAPLLATATRALEDRFALLALCHDRC